MKGRFVIFSDPKSIAVMDEIMAWVSDMSQASEEGLFDVRLALTEAINNAIIHGNAEDPEKQVVIDLDWMQGVLYCCVSDEGKGFEVTRLADPRSTENREREGGRGVLFIQEVAEHFIYCNDSRSAKFSIRLK